MNYKTCASIVFVLVAIYAGLTQVEACNLAIWHNDWQSVARPMNWLDNCIFMRKCLLQYYWDVENKGVANMEPDEFPAISAGMKRYALACLGRDEKNTRHYNSEVVFAKLPQKAFVEFEALYLNTPPEKINTPPVAVSYSYFMLV